MTSHTLYSGAGAQFANAGTRHYHARFTISAAGAVSAAKGKPFGTSSLVRTDEGEYTLTVPGIGSLDLLHASLEVVGGFVGKIVSFDEAARTVDCEFAADTADLETPTLADPDSCTLFFTLVHRGRAV